MSFDENCANSCLKNKRSAIVTILPNFSIVSKITAEVNVLKVIFSGLNFEWKSLASVNIFNHV